jgi:hypothetical protein
VTVCALIFSQDDRLAEPATTNPIILAKKARLSRPVTVRVDINLVNPVILAKKGRLPRPVMIFSQNGRLAKPATTNPIILAKKARYSG